MGNFHYKVMSFGLKNTAASYQQAKTVISYDTLHVCLEDYIGDIVLKFREVNNTLMIGEKSF